MRSPQEIASFLMEILVDRETGEIRFNAEELIKESLKDVRDLSYEEAAEVMWDSHSSGMSPAETFDAILALKLNP